MINNLYVMGKLTNRSLKIFCKDKASIFFSMLAPLIILIVYVLFLGDMQTDALKQVLTGYDIDGKVIQAFIDGWMLAGVIGVACITVSFSAQIVMVQDKEQGTLSDMLVSPIKKGILTSSYFFSNYVITILICSIVVVVEFIYLACTGWFLSIAQVFGIIGMVLLSSISSSLFSTLICKLLKTANSHGASVGIVSAVIGFVIGAYMPVSMFPKGLQYFTLLVPGTYSASVFRNLFMQGALAEIGNISTVGAEALKSQYVMNIDFFGKSIGIGGQILILFVSIAIFAAIFIAVELLKSNKKLIRKPKTTSK